MCAIVGEDGGFFKETAGACGTVSGFLGEVIIMNFGKHGDSMVSGSM